MAAWKIAPKTWKTICFYSQKFLLKAACNSSELFPALHKTGDLIHYSVPEEYLGERCLQAILKEQQSKNSRGKLEKQRWQWSGLGQDLVRRDFLGLQLIILGD